MSDPDQTAFIEALRYIMSTIREGLIALSKELPIRGKVMPIDKVVFALKDTKIWPRVEGIDLGETVR